MGARGVFKFCCIEIVTSPLWNSYCVIGRIGNKEENLPKEIWVEASNSPDYIMWKTVHSYF
eukprot:TRINITY_DN3890_c0_g1_i1.p1 TRINITY_DN3890_c0_g1~~TRINITY_DN3890_c0_g1_i1.p1  ORF type:complete len:61 (+),score=5.11 TRINITY_DN3890_c0_g1_i1:52-234(+)